MPSTLLNTRVSSQIRSTAHYSPSQSFPVVGIGSVGDIRSALFLRPSGLQSLARGPSSAAKTPPPTFQPSLIVTFQFIGADARTGSENTYIPRDHVPRRPSWPR